MNSQQGKLSSAVFKGCEFKLRSRNIRVLGIHCSTAVTQINSINCKGKLREIKRIWNAWSKRQITPLGKVTVIIFLILLKLICLFVTFPCPGDNSMYSYSTSYGMKSRLSLPGRLSASHMRKKGQGWLHFIFCHVGKFVG